MSSEQMRARIGSQTESLRRVLRHHCGPGRDALGQAAAAIRGARQVVITGMGASFYATLPLETYLCGLGINAIAVEAGELLHFRSRAYRDAVVVAVSRSGESIEIAKLLASIHPEQTVIGVCNRGGSRLAREANICIQINSDEDDIVALQTYTGTLLALALLGKAVESALDAAHADVERHLLPAFDQLIQSSLASVKDWDRFLDNGTAPYLLARGGSFASALEGALLFHEVSKQPAVAMPTASFRHGPVEVVESRFRAFVFAPAAPTQPLNVALAKDLVRFGGQVCVIGPQADNVDGLWLIETPPAETLFAPVLEVVPLQLAALRLAELRGVAPGSFRFAPPVALDEASFGPAVTQR